MQKPTQVVGRRVVQYIIDTVLYYAILVGTWFALTTQVSGKCLSSGGGITLGDHCRGFLVGESGKQTAWYLITFVGGLVIFVILPGLRGASPGMAAVGIRLVNAEGRPPGFWRALLRNILYIVDGFPFYVVPLVGFITALSTERNQRVGDMVASTFVIDKKAAAPQGAGPAFVQQPAFGAPPAGAPFQSAPPPPSGAPVPQANGGQKADWYPDPQGQARLRYWDGQRWTEHTSA
jgi:uncharacterized RDD family membrane protein YckC